MQRHVSANSMAIIHIIARLHSRIFRVTINLMMAMNWPKHIRCVLIRIYFLHTTVVLLTTLNIYYYTLLDEVTF